MRQMLLLAAAMGQRAARSCTGTCAAPLMTVAVPAARSCGSAPLARCVLAGEGWSRSMAIARKRPHRALHRKEVRAPLPRTRCVRHPAGWWRQQRPAGPAGKSCPPELEQLYAPSLAGAKREKGQGKEEAALRCARVCRRSAPSAARDSTSAWECVDSRQGCADCRCRAAPDTIGDVMLDSKLTSRTRAERCCLGASEA